ncbi:DUF4184 family protein [Klenkia terrae]|uniref:DUF4184 family protein n=1 Tax=Klenkia terrae TaxID=1052259 RepID=A0ABU8E1M6_9ACTN|nr:DUF4184 family protein [Klenkia terrae]
MPFTGSHPAAVLPFLRTRLPASALVIGSVVPDLPAYLPVDPLWRTHTWTAVVTVDLLTGLLVWALWHGVLSRPVVASSPAPLRARLAGVPLGLRGRLTGWRDLLVVAPAVVVGAATHVVLDAFTHPRRWGVDLVPALYEPVAGVPVYSWLADGGGVLGGLVLLGWCALWWRRTPAAPVVAGRGWAWGVVGLAALAGGLAGAPGEPDTRSAAVAAAFAGGGAAMATAAVLVLGWQARRFRDRGRCGAGAGPAGRP